MNKNSALIWLPKLLSSGLPTPKTLVVIYNHRNAVASLEAVDEAVYEATVKSINGEDGKEVINYILSVEESVWGACQKIGLPAFIRTDLSSAKHDGPRAYKVITKSDLSRVLRCTIEDNEMKFWLDSDGPMAVLVREWVDLESPFSAFGGHPINNEWRFFADPEKVHCFHPYWPESTIRFYDVVEPGNWRGMLKELHIVPENIEELKILAIQAASLFGRKCSVDIAKDKTGKWWIIDMATAEDSYHWPECDLLCDSTNEADEADEAD